MRNDTLLFMPMRFFLTSKGLSHFKPTFHIYVPQPLLAVRSQSVSLINGPRPAWPNLAPSCDGFRALYSPHLPAPEPHLPVHAMCLRSYTVVCPHRNYLKATPPLLPTGVSVKASCHKITASSGPTINP